MDLEWPRLIGFYIRQPIMYAEEVPASKRGALCFRWQPFLRVVGCNLIMASPTTSIYMAVTD